jgi:ABC-type phosphate/phosphonate transport system substrate-binding protein
MHWTAALPMYNVSPALADDWRALLDHVRTALTPWLDAHGDTLEIADPDPDLTAFWQRADLLLSQTCGYPLVHALDARVRLVATPEFDVPGCAGGQYHSVLLTGAHVGAASLKDCRGLRAVYNSDDSNSGMNLFRHAVAPFARDGRFFSTVSKSGGHLASMRALAGATADVAAIDCVTYAFAREHWPELAASVREIGVTASSAALPFIASIKVPEQAIELLFRALSTFPGQHLQCASRLSLKRFVRKSVADYAPIRDYERDAIAAGYPKLA